MSGFCEGILKEMVSSEPETGPLFDRTATQEMQTQVRQSVAMR
jgi:hypothetical protein